MKRLYYLILFIFPSVHSSPQTAEVIVQAGHTSMINCLAFSRDGKKIASGSEDKSIKIWDVRTQSLIWTFIGNGLGVKDLCFDHTGRYLVSSSFFSTIIWDVERKRFIREILNNGKNYNLVSLSRDGQFCALIENGLPILCSTQDFENRNTFRGTSQHFFSLKIDSLSRYLYGLCEDGYLYKLSIPDLQQALKVRLESLPTDYSMVSFNEQCDRILIGRENGNVYLYDIHGGTPKVFFPSDKTILSLSFSGRSNYLMGGSYWRKKAWMIKGGLEVVSPLNNSSTYAEIKINHTETHMVFQDYSGNVILQDLIKKKYAVLENKQAEMNAFTFSFDGTLLAYSTNDHDIKILNIPDGRFERMFENTPDNIKSIFPTSVDNVVMLHSATGNQYLTNLKTCGIQTIRALPGFETSVMDHSSGNDWFAIANKTGSIRIFDCFSGEELLNNKSRAQNILSIQFNKNEKRLFLGSGDHSIWKYDIKRQTDEQVIPNTTYQVFSLSGDDQSKYLVFTNGSYVGVYNKDKKIVEKKLGPFQSKVKFAEISRDGKYIAAIDALYNLKCWHTGDWKLLFIKRNESIFQSSEDERYPFPVCFSEDGKKLASVKRFNVLVYNTETGELEKVIENHSNYITALAFHHNDSMIISASADGSTVFSSISDNRYTRLYRFLDASVYITGDNYYYAASSGLKYVGFLLNNSIYPFSQFDLQYNRPDIVLERLGYASKELTESYRKAYQKRLKKMNFEESMFSPEFHSPEIQIVNRDSFTMASTIRKLALRIEAKDTIYKLDRINVWVNSIPVYGMNGINLRGRGLDSLEMNIPFELSQGNNKIQVSCLNEKGVESLKETMEIRYDPENALKQDMYFIGIGVSEYVNPSLNLAYASKDILDLTRLFIEKYPTVMIDTLIDDDATKENILKLKKKILQTHIDDVVIVAISGHGFLSDDLDFYYGTCDVDPRHPEIRGVSYDEIEWLLDSIPARKKLVFMDACHSGEVDKEIREKPGIVQFAENVQAKERKGAELVVDSTSIGLQNSFELMQELFTNLSKGNGAVVISAAGGLEYAYEGPDWKNGVFTYCVRRGLEKMEADRNKDQRVTVNELKGYLNTQVEKLTSGKQKPTSRRENIDFDWKVW